MALSSDGRTGATVGSVTAGDTSSSEMMSETMTLQVPDLEGPWRLCENAIMASKKQKIPKGPPEKVFQASVLRDDTKYLYYVDKHCNLVRMERGVARAKTETVVVTGLKREKGWDYFVDAQGDVSREPES